MGLRAISGEEMFDNVKSLIKKIKNILTFLRSSGRIEHGRGSSLCCLVLATGCGVLCSPGVSKIIACKLFTNKSFYSHWKERSLVM